MGKRNNRASRSGWNWFWIGAIFYAALFLGAIALGMRALWNYLEAYEASRSYIAVEAYMQQLTAEHVSTYADDLISQVDHNIQSEDECRQAVLDALDGTFSYARKASECSDTSETYVLYCGEQEIGSFTIQAGEADKYGFAPWAYSGEEFDLSFLLTETELSATAPEDCLVYVNGTLLDEEYITEILVMDYDVFAEFYEEYDLPVYTVVTYQVSGVFFGDLTIEVTDADGNPYEYDPDADINALVDNCTEEEIAALESFTNTFIQRYVTYASSANQMAEANYYSVVALVVSGSDLAQRLRGALYGQMYTQSEGDELESVTINHLVNIGDGKYLCDVTYVVNTTGHEGEVQSTLSVKLIITQSGSSYLVEAMTSY